MAPVPPRNGAFSPTLSSATSYTGNGPSRLNIVSRLAIEGKVKQNTDVASIKLYLKISVPVDSVTPGQIIPIFAEENVKIRDYSVHPLDSDSVPYDFSSTSHPLLHNAARALNLPARSTKSYLSLFDTTPQTTPVRSGSANGSAVPALEERYTGYFLISGYNVCYVLPKEFPMKYKIKGGTDSESDVHSPRGAPRTPSYRSGSIGRRPSIGERSTIQFMAGISLWVPFSSKPPKAPFMLSIPIPKCLSNNIKVRLPSPSSISTSFASLESDEDMNGWDLATEPHVTRTPPRHTSRTSAYTEFADDESSEASFTGGTMENCIVQGTFTSSDVIRIRWAAPLRREDFPDGRRRVGVDEVVGNMTCTVLESRSDGIKMRLDYQGTCTGVWFPGVATMLGMDVGLDTQGGRVTWPTDSDGQWTIDGDSAITGFTVGLPTIPLSAHTNLELPVPNASGLLGETIPNGATRHHPDNSASLLRAPLPNRRAAPEYSFEDSINASVPSIASSAMRSTDPESASESFARPPATPITVHINMNELAPMKNKLTFNISGTVLIAPGPGLQSINDSGHTTLPLPLFRVFSATKEDVVTTIRNQCDTASVELINSGSASSSSYNGSPLSRQNLNLSGSRAKKTVVPAGSQAKCVTPESSEILVKPLALRTPVRNQELSPQMLGRSVSRATASLSGSPEPLSAVLRSQASRSIGIRDGPLVIPWASVDVVPNILSTSSSTSEPLAPASKREKLWSYAVTLSMPTPVDGPSEWLELGLAFPLDASKSESMPAVEVSCASVNGVPVRFETSSNSRRFPTYISDSMSSVGGGSTSTIGAADVNDSNRKWVSWMRVHIALAGALEVVYTVKGRLTSDKKGKSKASPGGGSNVAGARVFVPVFLLPVTRYEISLRQSSDVVVQDTNTVETHSNSNMYRKLFIYDVPPSTHPRNDLFFPRSLLISTVKPSRAKRYAKKTWSSLITIMPYILSAILLAQMISMRREVHELRALIPTQASELGSGPLAGLWRETVTMTSTVNPTTSTKRTPSEGRWFANTYTVSISQPTSKSRVPSPSPSIPPGRENEDSEDDEVIDEDTEDTSGHVPALYVPLTWPTNINFQQTKSRILSGWSRVWHVVEIILHWPLPVDDDEL